MTTVADDQLCLAIFVRRRPSPVGATFIRAHLEHLPFDVRGYFRTGWQLERDKQRVWSRSTRWSAEHIERIAPRLTKAAYNRALARELRREGIDCVLAEYGNVGADIMRACHKADVPLVVHFRGKDASNTHVLERYLPLYREMFSIASAIVAVSNDIRTRLESWGAPEHKLHVIPSGVDHQLFYGASPANVGPEFLAVGRFVAKKAPHLTVRAFRKVVDQIPDARLRMVGTGPLLEQVEREIDLLDLSDNIQLLGRKNSMEVAELMRASRCFVQHSVTTSSGDREGAPKTISEAQVSGLPVVATDHGGIPEIVVPGQSALLVPEYDVHGMAKAMLLVGTDNELASRLSLAARNWGLSNLTLASSLAKLALVIRERPL